MDKDINDYTYGDLQGDIKLKSFIEHSTPAEIDISGIKKKAFLKMHQHERKSRQRLRFDVYWLSSCYAAFFNRYKIYNYRGCDGRFVPHGSYRIDG